jgi:murein DD-endopeptidase MepM/ murein hydrolase activator NlpD
VNPSKLLACVTALSLATVATAGSALAQPFTYDPPGTLVPARSGRGRVDAKVYAPTMRFPMEQPQAFANSQVYGNGGGQGVGGQCDAVNYSYPWHDNYCESRSYSMPLCPSGTGHQGQDIRPPTCLKDTHWVVAAEAGTITSVGSYSLYLTAADGTRFDYLHMSQVQVAVGARVTKGQRIGKVSNVFGGTPTTIHLHFNLRQNVAAVGAVYVPPYTSLIDAFKRAKGLIPSDAGTPGDAAPKDGSTDGAPRDGETPPVGDPGFEDPPPDPGPDELPTPEGELAAEQGELPPSADPDSGCNGAGTSPSFATLGIVAVGFVSLFRRRKTRA